MFQWIETIRVVNGNPQNVFWHQKRMNETFMQFTGDVCPFSLDLILRELSFSDSGIFKLRIVYSLREIVELEILSYSIRLISKFYLVERHNIDYAYKFEERRSLDSLDHLDAEPIIVQNGLITDTRYSNLIFKKDNSWYTPTSFLLNGTMRQKLLAEGAIFECKIDVSDLLNYSHFKMINAMMPPEHAILYNIDLLIRKMPR